MAPNMCVAAAHAVEHASRAPSMFAPKSARENRRVRAAESQTWAATQSDETSLALVASRYRPELRAIFDVASTDRVAHHNSGGFDSHVCRWVGGAFGDSRNGLA